MATIKPFKGLRPAKELAGQVSAQPYDSSHPEISHHEFNNNPNSYLHVVKPYMNFPGEKKNPEKHFPIGLQYLNAFKEKGILKKDTQASFYIYRVIHGSKAFTGLIAAASIDDYLNNNILKHENTLTEKQDELAQHISYFNGLGNPVLLTYPDNMIIDDILEKYIRQHKPEYNFISIDQLKHNLWVVTEAEDLLAIEQAFNAMTYLYIADGHHRTAGCAAFSLQERAKNDDAGAFHNYFPVCLIPFSKLHIYEYHRLIKDEQLVDANLISELKKYFEVIPSGNLPVQPLNKKEFGVYFNKHAYLIKLKPEFEQKLNGTLENLDVNIVEEFILKKIFGIKDSKTDKRLGFLDGSKGILNLKNSVDKEENSIAITLFPSSIDEVKKVAEEGLIMPPKSTWIEPKIRTGLVIYETL